MSKKNPSVGALDAHSIDVAFAYLIQRSARLLRMHFLSLLSSHGYDLTPEQWFILNRLWEGDGVTQSELSDRAFNDRPNVTRMVDALERAGLVQRQVDQHDRRACRVYLTDRGKAIRQELWPVAIEGRKRVYKGLTENDLAELRRILGVIDRNLTGA